VLNCEDVLAELANYLDDQVATAIRRELELHLAECRTCQVLHDSARKTLRIITESRSFDLPEKLSARLMGTVMARVRGGHGRPARRRSRSATRSRSAQDKKPPARRRGR